MVKLQKLFNSSYRYCYVLLCFFLLTNAYSKDLQARFQDWSVFKTERGDRIVCYVASIPIKREGNYYNRRGEPFFLVTNIENDADEISASSGFIYNKSSNVEVSFRSKKFYLFPHRSLAWANDRNDDIDIIKEMQRSANMVVTGIAYNGKISVDTYSLIGFSESYQKLQQICKNLK